MVSPDDPLSVNLWQGPRVRLVALNYSDTPIISGWHNDLGMLRHFDAEVARPRSEDDVSRWLDDVKKNPRTFVFGIQRLEDAALIGMVSIEDVLWPHGAGWLSILIGERANQGRGYGYEAMRLVLDYAFRELNLHRVQLSVFQYNTRAIALYEKLGFQREGVYREFVLRDGRRYDMYLYGLLSREWQP